ncbi:MAG TPA: STAS domain-containing protein [Stellaceae bacterium]|jgi:rsbT co-antagonist protein RsbR|nr:STAS domain-containing protein [Stellaceae bacterium]
MISSDTGVIADLVRHHEGDILRQWLDLQKRGGTLQTGRIGEAELTTQSGEFLQLLRDGFESDTADAGHAAFAPARETLAAISRSRAMQGFSPRETATFIFSLKQPLVEALNRDNSLSATAAARLMWIVTSMLDQFGLITFENFQRAREELISRQTREISELSTPVVKLWDGILALPIIGTLDSERTQIVMENLLQSIVDQGAEIAIIDITGVPTVDTLTAQHLLKTVAAARLMGADCIISGIRPQIAQTIVHLGVELNVVTKATLADAFTIALRRTGRAVTKVKAARTEQRRQPDEQDD